jgi:hypothetical protein
MKPVLDRIKFFLGAAARQAKLRKGLTFVLAVFLFLQLYFVRELIAAELLFGLGSLVLFALVTIFYAVGFLGERSFQIVESGAHAAMPFARRGYAKIEEISKKPFRHPRSESAQ